MPVPVLHAHLATGVSRDRNTFISTHTGQTDRLTAPAQSMMAATQGHTLLRAHTNACTHIHVSEKSDRRRRGGTEGEQLIVDYLLITSADRLCIE